MMNPLFEKFAGGIARALLASALMPGVNWLTKHGYLSAGDTEQLMSWLAGLLVVIAWSLISKHTEQLKLLVAASTHDVITEREIEKKIESGDPLPAVTTKKDEVPVPSTPATFGR